MYFVLKFHCTIYLMIFFTLRRHNITSDIWSSFHLQFQNHTSPAGETTPISIAHAINLWMRAATSEPRKSVRFHDACNGPYCNRECPESVVLGAVYPYWGTSYQIVILVLIVGVAFVGVVVKVGLSVRDLVLSAKQKAFLKRICLRFVDESESAVSLNRKLNLPQKALGSPTNLQRTPVDSK